MNNESTNKESLFTKLSKIYHKIPKQVLTIITVAVLTTLGLWLFGQLQQSGTEQDEAFIGNYLRQTTELSTVEYAYTYTGEYEDSREIDLFVTKFDVPFTKKWFIVTYEGTIKYGIDLMKVEDPKIDSLNKVITIKMPVVMKIAHDDDNTQFIHEDNNLFNPFTPQDAIKFIEERKRAKELQLEEDGILDVIHSETEGAIKKLIVKQNPEYAEYEVRCKFENQNTISKGELPENLR